IGSPADVYANPASLFAASFVGAANVLPGIVISDSNTTARVSLGCELELDSTQGGFGIRNEVDVFCRPEQLVLSLSKPDGANGFQALVEQTVFMGNSADVFLKRGPLELKARVSPAAHWPPATELWVKIAPESVRLLPRSTA